MTPFRLLTVLRTGGEFTERHVEWLQKQVNEPIWCLTNSKEPMKNVTSIPFTYNWPHWWGKIEMFRPDIVGEGNFLYSDLDTVFLKGIPEEIKKLTKTHVLNSVSNKPDYMNSGLMFIAQDVTPEIWIGFSHHSKQIMEKFQAPQQGDQDYLNLFLKKSPKLQDAFPNQIVSFKMNIRNKSWNGRERIVCFHGKPRPWEIQEHWIPRFRG